MNKTAILSFIIDEVALKCRNVSSNMRKRIHWMLKYREIRVKKYDERALVLNGWVRVGKYGAYVSEEEMKKGVSSYRLETQEQVDRMMTLNNEIRCNRLYFTPTAPIEVESIEDLFIYQSNYNMYSKCSFNRIKQLELSHLSLDQIIFILSKFKRVVRLEIHSLTIEIMVSPATEDLPVKNIDFSQLRIKQFYFGNVEFQEPLYLPKEISKLEICNCQYPNLIRAQRINEICINNPNTRLVEWETFFNTVKGVKVVRNNKSIKECVRYLPSTVRKIETRRNKIDGMEEIVERFPNLIDVDILFAIEELDKTKLRAIYPKIIETEEKFNLRPRKIIIDSNNAIQLNNHPELFEKVEWVYIESNKFNFDVLPSEIKRIQFRDEMDFESTILNRLEKERE